MDGKGKIIFKKSDNGVQDVAVFQMWCCGGYLDIAEGTGNSRYEALEYMMKSLKSDIRCAEYKYQLANETLYLMGGDF